jgi:hypothetical protein
MMLIARFIFLRMAINDYINTETIAKMDLLEVQQKCLLLRPWDILVRERQVRNGGLQVSSVVDLKDTVDFPWTSLNRKRRVMIILGLSGGRTIPVQILDIKDLHIKDRQAVRMNWV